MVDTSGKLMNAYDDFDRWSKAYSGERLAILERVLPKLMVDFEDGNLGRWVLLGGGEWFNQFRTLLNSLEWRRKEDKAFDERMKDLWEVYNDFRQDVTEQFEVDHRGIAVYVDGKIVREGGEVNIKAKVEITFDGETLSLADIFKSDPDKAKVAVVSVDNGETLHVYYDGKLHSKLGNARALRELAFDDDGGDGIDDLIIKIDGVFVLGGTHNDVDLTRLEIIYNGSPVALETVGDVKKLKDLVPGILVKTKEQDGFTQVEVRYGDIKLKMVLADEIEEFAIDDTSNGEGAEFEVLLKDSPVTTGGTIEVTKAKDVTFKLYGKDADFSDLKSHQVSVNPHEGTLSVSVAGAQFTFEGDGIFEKFYVEMDGDGENDLLFYVKNEEVSVGDSLKLKDTLFIYYQGTRVTLEEAYNDELLDIEVKGNEAVISWKHGKFTLENLDMIQGFFLFDDGLDDQEFDLWFYADGSVSEGGKVKNDFVVVYRGEEITIDQLIKLNGISFDLRAADNSVTIVYEGAQFTYTGAEIFGQFETALRVFEAVGTTKREAFTFEVDGNVYLSEDGKTKHKDISDVRFFVDGAEVLVTELLNMDGYKIKVKEGKGLEITTPDGIKHSFEGQAALNAMQRKSIDFGAYDYMSEDKFNFEAWAHIMGSIYGGLSPTGQTGTSFSVANNVREIELGFDFFELGTWDGEEDGDKLTMNVNGIVIDLGFYDHRTVEGNSEWTTDHGITISRISSAMKTIEGTGTQTRGQDQVHRFTVILGSEAIGVALKDGQTQLTVGFDAHLNQGVGGNGFYDENYAIAALKIKTQVSSVLPPYDFTPQDYYDGRNQQDQEKLLGFLAYLEVETDTSSLSEIELGAYFRNLAKNGSLLEDAVEFKEFYSYFSEYHKGWQDLVLKIANDRGIPYDVARAGVFERYPALSTNGVFIAVSEAVAALEAVYALSGLPAAIDAPNPGNPTSYGPAYYQIVNGLVGAEEKIETVINSSREAIQALYEGTQDALSQPDYAGIGFSANDKDFDNIVTAIDALKVPSLTGENIDMGDFLNTTSAETNNNNEDIASFGNSLVAPSHEVSKESYLTTFSDEQILEMTQSIEGVMKSMQEFENWSDILIDQTVKTINYSEYSGPNAWVLATVVFYTIGSVASLSMSANSASITYMIGSLTSSANLIDGILTGVDGKPTRFDVPEINLEQGSFLENIAIILNEAEGRIEAEADLSDTLKGIENSLKVIETESRKAADAIETFAETIAMLSKLSALTSYDFDRSLAIEDPSNYDESDYKDREKERLLESQINEITSEWDDEFEGIIDGVSVDWVVGYSEIASRGPEAWKDQENQLLSEGVNRHEFVASAMNIVAFKAIFSGGALDELGENDRKLVVTWERDTRFNERYEEVQNFDLVDVSWG